MLTDRSRLEVQSEEDCLALLQVAHVGRIALHQSAQPASFPCWTAAFCSTSREGTKLRSATDVLRKVHPRH